MSSEQTQIPAAEQAGDVCDGAAAAEKCENTECQKGNTCPVTGAAGDACPKADAEAQPEAAAKAE